MTSLDMDVTRYLRAPVLDVARAVALGIALLAAMDKSLTGGPKKTAKHLRERVLELQARWKEQRAVAAAPKVDPRPADQRLDRAWAAVGRRLETLAELPESVPQSKDAAALHAQLFPKGLAFLALSFDKQWAESQQRIELLADATLSKQLETLVGDFVVTELLAAHTDYGRVLGITAVKSEEIAAPLVVEPLRAVTQAIAAHALQLVAAAHADPDLTPLVRRALRPIDDVRAAQTKRAAAGQSPAVPDDTLEPAPSSIDPGTPVPDIE